MFAMLFSLQPNAVLLLTYSTTPACLSTKCIHGTKSIKHSWYPWEFYHLLLMWKCDIFSSLGECIVNVISWEGGKTKNINKPRPTGKFPESLDSLDIHFIQWWSLALWLCQLSLMSFLSSHFRGEKNSYSEKKKKKQQPFHLPYHIRYV